MKCSFHSLPVGLFVEWEREYSHQKLGADPDEALQSKRKEHVSASRKLGAPQCRGGGLFPFSFDHQSENKHQKFQIWSQEAFFPPPASVHVVVAVFLQESHKAGPDFRLWHLLDSRAFQDSR